jgi:ubiquinone/menaquinone biosynthesis C-methylase UbiE
MKSFAPIHRTKAQARRFYGRISAFYDGLTASEKPLILKGVVALAPQPGETFLEIGCGTGTGLAQIEEHLQGQGAMLGLDLSLPMLRESRKKVKAD